MATEHEDGNDQRQVLAMLREISELAEHASLTGAMSGGAPSAVRRYNALLQRLVDSGKVKPGMFEPLGPNADFGELAVDSRLLRAYIKGDNGNGGTTSCGPERHLIMRIAPFAEPGDLRELVDAYLSKGSPVDTSLIESLAPFLDKGDLGHLIRRIAGSTRVEVQVRTGDDTPGPAAPTKPEPCVTTVTIDEDEAPPPAEPLVHRDVPVEDRLRALTDRMRDADTTAEEFEELAAEVRRLKTEKGG